MRDFNRLCAELLFGCILVLSMLLWIEAREFVSYAMKDEPKHQFKRCYKNPLFLHADIIIGGNSQAFFLNDSILNSELDRTVFMHGSPGLDFAALSASLLDRIVCDSPPELLIIENHSFRDKMPEKHSIYLPKGFDLLKRIDAEWSLIKYPFRETIHFRSSIEGFPSLTLQAVVNPQPTAWSNGFRESPHEGMDSMDVQVRYNDDWIPYPDQIPADAILADVAKFIELCQASEVEVILYESPWYKDHCAPQIQRNSAIENLATEMNVPWVNFNLDSALVSEPAYYESTPNKNQHLSKAGAEAVSMKLAAIIKNHLESEL